MQSDKTLKPARAAGAAGSNGCSGYQKVHISRVSFTLTPTLPPAKLLIRGISIVCVLWGVYRHGLTPEWVMRSVQGHEIHLHSWFWQPPNLPDWSPIGVRWWRSLLAGGSFVLIGIQGWRLSGAHSTRRRHPDDTPQQAGPPSRDGGWAFKTRSR